MTTQVRKGYSPENLEGWERKERQQSLIALAFIVTAYVPLVICSVLGIHDLTEHLSFAVAFVLIIAGGIFAMDNIEHRSFRYILCNALAGLELGVYHCSDDLVILLNLPRDCADKIIDGQYDNWLRHRITCQFMPY